MINAEARIGRSDGLSEIDVLILELESQGASLEAIAKALNVESTIAEDCRQSAREAIGGVTMPHAVALGYIKKDVYKNPPLLEIGPLNWERYGDLSTRPFARPILTTLAQGHERERAAEIVGISPKEFEFRENRLIRVFNARTRSKLVRMGLELGIVHEYLV